MNKKYLQKLISSDYEYKFDCRKCNLNQNWNKDKSRYDNKNPIKNNIYIYIKIYIWNPGVHACKVD